jgi:hypothetical protein
MSYEEEDTYHMRRRIHVGYTHHTHACILSHGRTPRHQESKRPGTRLGSYVGCVVGRWMRVYGGNP